MEDYQLTFCGVNTVDISIGCIKLWYDFDEEDRVHLRLYPGGMEVEGNTLIRPEALVQIQSIIAALVDYEITFENIESKLREIGVNKPPLSKSSMARINYQKTD